MEKQQECTESIRFELRMSKGINVAAFILSVAISKTGEE
jgi:hypothetical protein